MMSWYPRLGACFLVSIAVACSSSSDPGDGDNNNDEDDNGAVITSTYAEVADIAKMIYDAVEAGEDVTPHIEGVFEAFNVPVLAVDDVTGALERLDAGLPFVTTLLVQRMAESYADGRVTDAKGFAEGLVEQGLSAAYPFNLSEDGLTSDLLGAMMYSYTVGAESEPNVPMEDGTVLPTLVRALGQERAQRSSDDFIDPIWADGRLDPLQFTLLSFTIFAKPVAPDPYTIGPSRSEHFQTNPAADFIKDKIKDQIKDKVEGELTSVVQGVVEVPLDKKDAAKISVCGSLILYGHKLALTNTPDLLWHAPKTPNLTTVKATLTFEDDYYDNWARAVLGSAVTDLTGCAFPRKGPIEGKSIKWDISSGLEGHGSYDILGTVTNDLGESTSTWRTITDDTPLACQVFENQRDAVGATEAVVTGLLPGWSTVEAAVTFLNPNTGGQGNAPLTVLYYEVEVGDPCHAL